MIYLLFFQSKFWLSNGEKSREGNQSVVIIMVQGKHNNSLNQSGISEKKMWIT